MNSDPSEHEARIAYLREKRDRWFAERKRAEQHESLIRLLTSTEGIQVLSIGNSSPAIPLEHFQRLYSHRRLPISHRRLPIGRLPEYEWGRLEEWLDQVLRERPLETCYFSGFDFDAIPWALIKVARYPKDLAALLSAAMDGVWPLIVRSPVVLIAAKGDFWLMLDRQEHDIQAHWGHKADLPTTDRYQGMRTRYDNANRLVYKGDPGPASGIGYGYTLDMNGNRVSITENDGYVTENVYDNKNRLTQETRTGGNAYSCQYVYDLNGSVTARDLPSGGRVTFTLDSCGRITSDTSGTSYSWNSDGRLTSRTGGIGTLAWDYDYAGRVTSMTLGDGTTLTYNMDGDGRVQNGTRNRMAFRYLLDGRDVLREWVRTTTTYTITAGSVALRVRDLERLQGLTYPVGSQQVIDYTHGHGLISQRITETDYFRWDGRSTTGQIEAPDGTVRASQVYDAYGLLRSTATLTSAYGFVGEEGVRQEKTPPSSPYHMRARVYDPLLCRFTSRDPIWSENLYEYAAGNPWGNVDPDGRTPASARYFPGNLDPSGKLEDFLVRRGWDKFPADTRLTLRDLLTLIKDAHLDITQHDHRLVQSFWRNLFEAEIAVSWGDPIFHRRAIKWRDDYDRQHPVSGGIEDAVAGVGDAVAGVGEGIWFVAVVAIPGDIGTLMTDPAAFKRGWDVQGPKVLSEMGKGVLGSMDPRGKSLRGQAESLTNLAMVLFPVTKAGLASKLGGAAADVELEHLTTSEVAESISGDKPIPGMPPNMLISPHNVGLYALEAARVPKSPFARAAATMARGGLTAQIKIAGDAAKAFRRPPLTGPINFFRRSVGVRFAPAGAVDLAKMKFIPNVVWDAKAGMLRPLSWTEWSRYKPILHEGGFIVGDAFINGLVVVLGGGSVYLNLESARVSKLNSQPRRVSRRRTRGAPRN